MTGMKKYMIIGMAAVIVFSAIILMFGIFTEKPQEIRNNTNNIETFELEADEILESFERYNDPMFEDSILFIQIAEQGSDDIDFKINSVAVHNTYFDVWYIVNKNKNIDVGEELFIKGFYADAGVIYNRMYIYTPEASVNGTKAEMPEEKFYIPAEFLTLMPEENSFIRLTFLKDESVFEKNGTYIFAPQVLVETYNNVELEISSDSVEVVNGTLWMNVTMGMNNNGNFLANAKYNPDIE